MELALTLFAFDVSNKLATLLVGTGLIFIPVAWLFWKNWYEPARSQEAKSAAPVSLRRMEQDIGLAMLAMLLAFLPAISISASDVTYTSPLTKTEVTADPSNTDTASAPQRIRVPVLWWAIIQISSGFTEIFKAAIHSFGEPMHIRSIIMALDYASLSDAPLISNLQNFDQHCYFPALDAIGTAQPSERKWRGDKSWFEKTGDYNFRLPEAPLIPDGWEDQYSQPDNVGPTCAIWWSAQGKGLRDRLFEEIKEITNAQTLENLPELPKYGISGTPHLVQQNPTDEYKDKLVRSHLDRHPPASSSPDDPDQLSERADFFGLATLGSWFVYPVIRTTMAALISVLPIIQAIVLACIYIALPLAVPFAVVRPGVLVFFIAAIFGTKFLTGIWSLARFIDERLINMMYGERSVLAGIGTGGDVLLTIVSVMSYVGLPVIWFWLMSSFTSRAIAGVNSLFTSTAGQMAMVGQAGWGQATNLGGQGATSYLKHVAKLEEGKKNK